VTCDSESAPSTAKKKKKGTLPAKECDSEAHAADSDSPGTSNAKADKGTTSTVGCTVFVDGVPYTWSVDKISELFSRCGKVAQVRAPTWQDSGRLRGYAHVTFADKTACKKALDMDGIKVGAKGRFLKIEAAKDVEEKETPAAADLTGKRRLFVKNLPYEILEAEIRSKFGPFGKIVDIRVPTSFGRSKGFAYIEFASSKSLQKAVEAQPLEIEGRKLILDADSGQGPKAGFHYRGAVYEESYQGGKSKGKGGKSSGKGGKSAGKGKGKSW